MTTVRFQQAPRSSAARQAEQFSDEVMQLRRKLASQPVIEQAKGMLMEAFGLTAEHAFELLRSISQDNNVKVRDVAHWLVEHWTSDGPRPDYGTAAEFLVTVRRRFSSDSQVYGTPRAGTSYPAHG